MCHGNQPPTEPEEKVLQLLGLVIMMHDRNTQPPWLENKAETFHHPENYEGHINGNNSKKMKDREN